MIFERVSKAYGDTAVLNELSFEVKEGEITAILGESGAGKTTLLNAVSGLISYEGSIDGKEGKHPRKRERLAYLFQEVCLLPNLTAEKNLQFVLPRSEWENVPKMLEKVGLKGKERSYPHQLSGGEKQRVAIARAFLFPHDYLLMDEPFSSLDLALKKSLIELVVSLWQEKKSTVLLVTHDVKEAVLLARRAIVLKGGKIKREMEISSPYPRDFFAPSSEEVALIHTLTEG